MAPKGVVRNKTKQMSVDLGSGLALYRYIIVVPMWFVIFASVPDRRSNNDSLRARGPHNPGRGPPRSHWSLQEAGQRVVPRGCLCACIVIKADASKRCIGMSQKSSSWLLMSMIACRLRHASR